MLDLLARRGAPLSLDDLRGGRRAVQAAVRARCAAVPMANDTVLCRILGRYKMLADARDLGLSPHLILDGYWEMWATRFLLDRVKPGMVAWDVGANLGYYAVLMADLVGPSGRVLAVEPNPRLAALCARNLALNGFAARAAVREAAAADRAGERRFRAAPEDPKNGHLLEGDAARGDADITVATMRLDALGERVDVLKIDVEGAEEAAWAGLSSLLDRNPGVVVLMEVNARRCRDPDSLLRDVAARFPLRELRTDGGVHPVEAAAVLDRAEDTLLVLSRGA